MGRLIFIKESLSCSEFLPIQVVNVYVVSELSTDHVRKKHTISIHMRFISK